MENVSCSKGHKGSGCRWRRFRDKTIKNSLTGFYHEVREIGIPSMKEMTDQTFERADKELVLLYKSSTIKVHDEKVPTDFVIIFQRMITKTLGDGLDKGFSYEIALYPLLLFDALGMLKTQRSVLYDCF